MAIVNVTKENIEELKTNNETLLLDFYADWCGPCRMIAPIVHEIAEETPGVTVGKVNVDIEGELAEEFAVFSIPTLVVMKNGKIVAQSAGAKPKAQVLAMLES